MIGLALDVEHFRARVLQDALNEATAAYWRRRAEAFQASRPRPDDYHGHATVQELRDRDQWCAAIARACRHRAELMPPTDYVDPAIRAALAEVA